MTDYDYKKHCFICQGSGQVDTGIIESPVTVCNQCNGTGLKAQRTWVEVERLKWKGDKLFAKLKE